MTDYTPPACRISVTYAAADGTVPESMEIEWATRPSLDVLHEAVHALAAVAGRRDYTVELGPMETWAKTPTSFALAEQEQAALAEKYAPRSEASQ